MGTFKALLKKLMALAGYRISKGPGNRFQEIETSLTHLGRLGFKPSMIIDGGAHVGSFACAAHEIFPEARIHMIEPQPNCKPLLTQLVRSNDRLCFHPIGLSENPGVLPMVCTDDLDAGAYVVGEENRSRATIKIEVSTLDLIFAYSCGTKKDILLKLDLQEHELSALKGASAILPHVEVVLIEVSFFQQVGGPTILELVKFLEQSNFILFEIASLSGRRSDGRLRQGDFIFVRKDSPLRANNNWE